MNKAEIDIFETLLTGNTRTIHLSQKRLVNATKELERRGFVNVNDHPTLKGDNVIELSLGAGRTWERTFWFIDNGKD